MGLGEVRGGGVYIYNWKKAEIERRKEVLSSFAFEMEMRSRAWLCFVVGYPLCRILCIRLVTQIC